VYITAVYKWHTTHWQFSAFRLPKSKH